VPMRRDLGADVVCVVCEVVGGAGVEMEGSSKRISEARGAAAMVVEEVEESIGQAPE